ncbi:MAG: LPP20 family lipoprotein [Armatimonadetes bacterium]|nr:LPP20 family lipoprotein [Armatimonadota bacterium]
MPVLLPLLFAVLLAPPETVVTTTTTTVRQNAADNDPLVDTSANGKARVNYAAGVVKATGSGAPPAPGVATSDAQARLMALGAAKADALRNLAMMVSSVQVTSETRVKNFQTESDIVETRLEATLKNARVIREDIGKDGTATVTMELPLYGAGSVAEAVFPEVLTNTPSAPPAIGGGSWAGPEKPAIRLPRPVPTKPLPALPEPGLTDESDTGPFTSVLIDCRGLNISAIMSPKLMDDAGNEVYGTVRVTPEYAIAVGVVGYPRSMSEALRAERTGSRPLIIRAIGSADKYRFNPVISSRDAARVLAANGRDGFLEKTAVSFLVDPAK